MAPEEVVVLVLDDGPDTHVTAWGWRGHIVFRGRWDAKPAEIARDTSRRLAREVHLHAVVHHRGQAWVVLRWATEYHLANNDERDGESAPPQSRARLRAGARRAAAGG